MSNKITKIWQKTAPKKSFWLFAGMLTLLALSWIFGAEPVLAADPPAASAVDQGAAVYQTFIQIALLIQQLLNKILWPILFMIGGLIDNDLIFNHGMETRLLAIWVQIRNIVNVLFVVALVGVALYNVLGIGGEGDQFSLKSVLPKLIVAIVAVNFSYVAIKVVLDTVSVLTTAVFGLPEAVEAGLSNPYASEDERKFYEETVCTQLYGSGGATLAKVQKSLNDTGHTDKDASKVLKQDYFCDGVKFNQAAKDYFSSYNAKNASLIMAVTMSKVAFIDKAALNSAKSFSQVSLNVLFSLILYFVYVTSFLAFFIILVARLIVLWLGVALSPFLLLSLGMPAGLKEKLGIFEKMKFWKHAFVPLEVAFPMTIGFMMLKAFQGISFGTVAGGSAASILSTGTLDIGVATSGISTFQELMIAVAAIGVVWVGVFGAAEGTIAEGVVGTLKEGAQSLGKFVGSSPFKYIPWVPVTDHTTGEKVNIAPGTLLDVAQAIPQKFERDSRRKAEKLFPQIMNGTSNTSDLANMRSSDDFERGMKGNHYDLKNMDKTALANLHKSLEKNPNIYKGTKGKEEFKVLSKALRDNKGKENKEVRDAMRKFYEATEWDKTADGATGGTGRYGVGDAAGTGATAATAATVKSTFEGENDFEKIKNKLPEDLHDAAKYFFDNKDASNADELFKATDGDGSKLKRIQTFMNAGKTVAKADGNTPATIDTAADQIVAAVKGMSGDKRTAAVEALLKQAGLDKAEDALRQHDKIKALLKPDGGGGTPTT